MPLQTDFSAGELAPELAMRRDTKQYRAGARSLLNNRILIGGGAKRRPGSWRLYQLLGPARIEEFVVNQTTKYILAFTGGRMDAYVQNVATGALSVAGSLTGCPWAASSLKTMDFVASGNTLIFTHPDFLLRVTRTGASSWSKSDFPWFVAGSGRIHQPHFKVADAAITLAPSALTGSVTLQLAGGTHWVAAHVGKRIRYVNKEIVITAVTDGDTATGTVIEELPPTQELTLEDAGSHTIESSADDVTKYYIGIESFNLGDVLEGSVTGAKGEVVAISTGDKKLTVVITSGVAKFAQGSGGDEVNGPNGRARLASVADASAPGAIADWTEQLYSDRNGWPRAAEIHRSRILLAGSAGAPSAIAGSSLANVYSFEIGTGSDGDGFLETIGDSSAVQIVQMHSAEQLLVLTDKGPYYVPESPQSPFRPTSLAFNHFGGEWPCADARVFAFDGGAVMISGSIVIKMLPTGNQTALWDAIEKSFLCPHLISTPVDTCVSSNYGGGPERYHFSVNEDGTLAVMQLVDAESVRNFVPWRTSGTYKSVCSTGGFIYAVAARTVGGSLVHWLELFDDALTLDGATEYATEELMTAGAAATYGSAGISVVADGPFYLGDYPPALTDLPAGPYRLGLNYDRQIETLPPNIEDAEGNHYGNLKRIVGAYVDTLESARFAANGYELMAYRVTEDPNLPPPLRTGPNRITFLGWAEEPTVLVTQPDPLPLTVRGIKTVVAY